MKIDKEEEINKGFLRIIHCLNDLPIQKQKKIGKMFRNNLEFFPKAKKQAIPKYLKPDNSIPIQSSPPNFLKQKTMIFVFLATLCYYFFNDNVQRRRCDFIYQREIEELYNDYDMYISSWEITKPIRENLNTKKLEYEKIKKENAKALALYNPNRGSLLGMANPFSKQKSTGLVLSQEIKSEFDKKKNDLLIMENLIVSTETTLRRAGLETEKTFQKNTARLKSNLKENIQIKKEKKEICIETNKTNELFFYAMTSIITIYQLFDRENNIVQFILSFTPYSAVLNNHNVDFMLVCFLNAVYFREIGYRKIANKVAENVFYSLAQRAKEGNLGEVFNLTNAFYSFFTTFIIAFTIYVIIKEKFFGRRNRR